jgi:hypothetical protein
VVVEEEGAALREGLSLTLPSMVLLLLLLLVVVVVEGVAVQELLPLASVGLVVVVVAEEGTIDRVLAGASFLMLLP